MERVRDRKAHVALLLGYLELYLETSSTRQVPDRRAGNGYEGAAPDCGDCETAAGRGERTAYHCCGCGVSLAAAEDARQLHSPSKISSTYPGGYASVFSLDAALLNWHFERPGNREKAL